MLTVVYGPPASGKTRNRDKLAARYRHTRVIDGITRQHWLSRRFYDDNGHVYEALPQDALLLTNMTRSQCLRFLQKHERVGILVPIEVALKEVAKDAS